MVAGQGMKNEVIDGCSILVSCVVDQYHTEFLLKGKIWHAFIFQNCIRTTSAPAIPVDTTSSLLVTHNFILLEIALDLPDFYCKAALDH